MSLAQDFDRISIEQLRAVGSMKWTMFPDTISAFVAEMDFGTAPEITEALHAMVDDALFGYLPPDLSQAVSKACADWQATNYGWQVEPRNVHPVPNVLRALEITIESFSRPGSPVIVPVPAYMPFLKVASALGRETIQVPMAIDGAGRYSYDLDALGRAFDQGGNLLILCNPCNPVGRVFGTEELLAVCDVVAAAGGRVFADEIHSPLVFTGKHVPYATVSPVAAGHSVTATSASKAWNLPGLMCAQLIINNEADAVTWADLGPYAGHGAANPGVIATTAAYTSGRAWLDEVLAYLDGNRMLLGELLAEELPMIDYTPPEGTYIAWLDCRELGLNEDGLAGPAGFFHEHAGVVLTDGAACGAPGFVRMIFATPRPILTEAVRRMGKAVRERLPAAI
jgi:cystathionine beta-lyase